MSDLRPTLFRVTKEDLSFEHGLSLPKGLYEGYFYTSPDPSDYGRPKIVIAKIALSQAKLIEYSKGEFGENLESYDLDVMRHLHNGVERVP